MLFLHPVIAGTGLPKDEVNQWINTCDEHTHTKKVDRQIGQSFLLTKGYYQRWFTFWSTGLLVLSQRTHAIQQYNFTVKGLTVKNIN